MKEDFEYKLSEIIEFQFIFTLIIQRKNYKKLKNFNRHQTLESKLFFLLSL